MAIEVSRPISAIGIGAYSLRDAALILGIPFSKLRRWAAGYWYSVSDDERFSEPVVGGPHDEMDERILSFLELMELGVIGFYRSEGVSMTVVREARIRAQQMFLTEYPFATKRLETDGRGIFADLVVEGLGDSALTLELSKSQFAFTNCVAPFFRQKLDFSENGQAFRFWPLGRDMPVLLDAGRSYGRPITKHGSVPTFILYNMRQAGETTENLAAWYGLTINDVDVAVQFERSLRDAA